MSYEEQVPHFSSFLSVGKLGQSDFWFWARIVGVAVAVAGVIALFIWILFFRGKASSVAAQSAGKAVIGIANPFGWK